MKEKELNKKLKKLKLGESFKFETETDEYEVLRVDKNDYCCIINKKIIENYTKEEFLQKIYG